MTPTEYQAAYYQAHKEQEKAAARQNYQANKERHYRVGQAYRKQHPEYVRSSTRRRRARLRGAVGGHHSEKQWQVCLDWYGRCCANCDTSEQITRDHIVPLSKGGSDLIENIQPMCRRCNDRKGARICADMSSQS